MPLSAPAVRIREFDFTEIAPALGLATFAVVGGASKGLLHTPTFISSEQELIRAFGKPLLTDYALLSAIPFLRKGNRLLFTRVGSGLEAKADIPLPGLSGGTAAIAATGSVAFNSSLNPADGDTVTIRRTAPLVTLQADANGALGNVAITRTGTVVEVAGMIGGTVSAPATGSIRFLDAAQPADGNQIVLSDGTTVVTFEFDSNASVTESANLRQVVIGADSYATMANLIAKITAHAFGVSATDAVVKKTFEFDSNATFTAGNVGVLIGATAAATLLSLITAINGQTATIGVSAVNATVTVPALTLTSATAGRDGNGIVAKVGTNITVTGLLGGANVVAGSSVTVVGFYAVSPGTWGNSIVVVVSATTVIGAPAGRVDVRVQYPADAAGALVTVERFYNLSTDPTSARFMETALADGIAGEFAKSEYVIADVLANNGTISVGTYTLGTGAGVVGVDGLPTTSAHYIGSVSGQVATGLKALRNPEKTNFNLLAVPGVTHKDVIAEVLAIAAFRQDVFALIDTPFGLSRDGAVSWHNGTNTAVANSPTVALDTSYGGVFWAWVKDYDEYSQKNVWLPPSGFVAGAMAYSDKVSAPWFAAAGHTRGLIDADDVEYSPDLDERETLGGGQNRINPIVDFQSGLTVFGNRTLQRKQSQLCDINTRRMLIYAQTLVREAVKFLLFEPHDPLTWRRFELLVNPIMENIRAGRGLNRFQVVCDASTNTAALIGNKTMNGKILLEATATAEVIEVDFALFATGATFTTNF